MALNSEPKRRKQTPVAPARKERRLGFRLAAMLAVPMLLLLAAEGLLRVAGYGYRTSFFTQRQIDGRAVLGDNQNFGHRFFPPGAVRYPRPMAVPAGKEPGTVRVFVLGESAAMGDPDAKFGLPRMLEVLLQERFPQRSFQVVNASMVAINSHVIVPIARECAGLEADVWVIYMGNNEMIGPFGSLSVFGSQTPPLAFIRASLALKKTRAGQFLDATVHSLRARQLPFDWGGMAMWADQRRRHDDIRTARVYHHFKKNLSDILEAGRRAGIPVILCSVATNLKDCAPFASLHEPGISEAALAQWQAAYEQGIASEREGDFAGAAVHYKRASGLDAHHADLTFRMARANLKLGQVEQARRQFIEARDRDALQFRTDSQLNAIIRASASDYADQGVRFLDAEALLALNSPEGVPGREFFLEHVHFNPEGNYLLARAVAEEVAGALALSFAQEESSDSGEIKRSEWLSLAECLQAIGWTEWNRQDLLTQILERIEQPPFDQFKNSEAILALRAEVNDLRAARKPAQVRRSAQQVAQAVARRPGDADLRWNLAQLLDLSGDTAGAEEQWRAAIRINPYAHLPYFNLAKLLETSGKIDEARILFEQCLRINPGYFDARYSLGLLLTRQGQPEEATKHLRRAVRQDPRSAAAHLALGIALAQTSKPAKAELHFREVLRLDPHNAQAKQHLETQPGLVR
jgi:tetratricopeptide (TPR) repeat protein